MSTGSESKSGGSTIANSTPASRRAEGREKKIRLRDQDGEYGEPVTIYGDEKSIRYDEDYHRFTPVIDKRGLSILEAYEMDDYGLPDTASKESIFASFDDYKYNYKAGYDVSDSSFMFITKGGKFLSADEFRDLPKINPKNIIYVEEQNAAQNRIWYDNSRKEYKETVEKLTGYKLL